MSRWIVAVLALAAIAASPAAGTPEQTPKRGGAVVYGPTPELVCLNPVVTTCGGNANLESVLTPAFAIGPDFKARPKLVSRVTYTRTPPFTLTYHIRPEARWSDGVPVSAQDFVFTHGVIEKRLPSDPVHVNVRSVRAVDAKTVRVVLRSRFAGWRGLFWTVLPRHALASQDLEAVWSDRIDNPTTGVPIGNGPFLVERLERGRQLVLRRNPNYWGPHVAYLDRIVIRFCQGCTLPSQTEVLDAFRQGEVDLLVTRQTEIVPDLRQISGVRAVVRPTSGWENLVIRAGPGGHPALREKRVRRALAYAIDRVDIVHRVFGAIHPQYRPSDSAVFLTNVGYYRPNWQGYRYRPALARRLLGQAGCRRGADGIYSCAGRRLELRLATPPFVSFRVQTVQLVQSHLRQAGVEAVLNFTQPSALFNQVLPSGDFDLVALGFFGDPAGSGKKDLFGCGGPVNYTGYCQRLVTRDLDQADRILDADERARVLNRADRQMAKDVPVVPLFDIPTVVAFRQSIRDFVPNPHDEFWNAENWWLER